MSLLNLSPAEFCAATKPCAEGRDWGLTQPTMADVWDNCPCLDWLLWITDKLNRRPDDRTLRLFAVWCARNTPLPDGRKTGDLMTDPCSLAALKVAEQFANGMATQKELAAAWAAARYAASALASDAACAAWAAAWAASDAAWYAAWYAASNAALEAARYAESDAELNAASDAQSAYFRTLTPNPFRKEAQP